MLKISMEIMQTKLDWLDPELRGDLVKSNEMQKETKSKKRVLYTDEEKLEVSEEAQKFFLYCDEDLDILKNKAAKYGRDLDPVAIDGDCLLHAFRKQCLINLNWSIEENRHTLAYYMAKLPEQFILYANPYILNQSYESYVMNFWHGYSYGDELIAGVWGHIWNLKVTILSPTTPDLKCFHKEEEFPDIVLCHNGRPGLDGHYFATSKFKDFYGVYGVYVVLQVIKNSFTVLTSANNLFDVVNTVKHCIMM